MIVVFNDGRRQKNQKFLACIVDQIVAKGAAQQRNIAQPRHLPTHVDRILGDHSAQHDRLTGLDADCRLGGCNVLDRGFDNVSVRSIGEDRNTSARSQVVRTLLCIDVQQNAPIRTDSRCYLQNYPGLVLSDHRVRTAAEVTTTESVTAVVVTSRKFDS